MIPESCNTTKPILKKKEEFLQTVKTHAQVQSGQDLENFATGVLLKDENIKSVDIEESQTKVVYKVPAKFLGIFSASINSEVTVDNENRVKVKFPWYRFLYNLPTELQAKTLEEGLSSELHNVLEENVELRGSVSAKAEVVAVVTSNLKTRHDTVKNSIQNIR